MTRLSLRSLLTGTDEATLRECLQRWCDDTEVKPRRSAITRAATAMEDEALVLRRIAALPRKLQDLLEVFFVDGRAVRAVGELFEEVGDTFKSRFDLEATLAALNREAFVWSARDKRWASYDSPCWAVPGELVECVAQYRRRSEKQLQDSLTLQGFLDARYFRERGKKEKNGRGRAGGRGGGRSAGGCRG